MILCCNSQIIIDHSEIDGVNMMSKETDPYQEKLYYFLDLPNSYAGKSAPGDLATISQIKLNQVENWMSKQLTYVLHKPIDQTFQTSTKIFYAIDELWQLNLVDLSKLYSYKFILPIIDVLSKYGRFSPLKSKHGNEIKEALNYLNKEKAGHGTN